MNRPAALADLDLATSTSFTGQRPRHVRRRPAGRAAGPRRQRDRQRVLEAVRLAPPALSAYTASKAAVDALTRILAKELRGRDITVNAVAPGPTATAAFLDSTPAEEQEQLAAAPPLGRLGVPRTSRAWCRSWSGRPGAGSTGRSSTPTADSSDHGG